MKTQNLTAPTVAIEQIVYHWMDQAEYNGYVKVATGCTLYYTEQEEIFGDDESGLFGVVGFYVYRDGDLIHSLSQNDLMYELNDEAVEEYNAILV